VSTRYQISETTYELSPLAERERRTARAEIVSQRRFGLITSQVARDALVEVDKLMCSREKMREYDPDRNVKVTCQDCKAEHVMAGRIEYYRCECTPHEDRSALIGREKLD
jgi:hypothetical protein